MFIIEWNCVKIYDMRNYLIKKLFDMRLNCWKLDGID